MRHKGLSQHWLRRHMPDRHVCRVIWRRFPKRPACLEFSSICSHVPVGFGSRLLQLLPILIASGSCSLISLRKVRLAHLRH